MSNTKIQVLNGANQKSSFAENWSAVADRKTENGFCFILIEINWFLLDVHEFR